MQQPPPPVMFDLLGERLVTHPRPSRLTGVVLAPVLLLTAHRSDSLLPWLACGVLASWFCAIMGAVTFARLIGSMAPLSFFGGSSENEALALAAALYIPPALIGALTPMTAMADAVERRKARTATGLMHLVPSTQRRMLLASAVAWALAFCAMTSRDLGSSFIALYAALLPAAALRLAPRSSAALAVSVALPFALTAAPIAVVFVDVLRGLGGRGDATLGGVPRWTADARVAAAVGLWTAVMASYITPVLATTERSVSATLRLCGCCVLLAVAAAAGRPPFDEAHPRPVMLTHVLDLTTAQSALVLASTAPGPPLRTLARSIATSFIGSAGARGAGNTLRHVCYDQANPPKPGPRGAAASSLAHALVIANPGAWCELSTTSRDGMAAQALSALQWRTPGLQLHTLYGRQERFPSGKVKPAGPLHAVVTLDPSTSARWTLALNPGLVVRYAMAEGNETHRRQPPCDASVAWSPVRRPPRQVVAATRLVWPVVRHSGGTSGAVFTLWLELRLNATPTAAVHTHMADVAATEPEVVAAAEEEDVEEAVPRKAEQAIRLSCDWSWNGETVAWKAASTALPRTASLFGKATLPQALAVTTELKL
jgi:hypothetical protein